MVPSPSARRLTRLAAAAACTTAVAVSGELSTGALVAVAAAGVLVVVAGLGRRAGAAAPPVGRRGLPWLGWLAGGLAAEVAALLDDDLPALSDLADPLLVHPAARAAGTVAWLAAGAWLLARPGSRREHR